MDADVRGPTTPGAYWITFEDGDVRLMLLECYRRSERWREWTGTHLAHEQEWPDDATSAVPATPPRTPAPSLQAAREVVHRVCRLLEGETLSRMNPGPAEDAATLRALLDMLDGGVVVYVHQKDIDDPLSKGVVGYKRPVGAKCLPALFLPLPKEADDAQG